MKPDNSYSKKPPIFSFFTSCKLSTLKVEYSCSRVRPDKKTNHTLIKRFSKTPPAAKSPQPQSFRSSQVNPHRELLEKLSRISWLLPLLTPTLHCHLCLCKSSRLRVPSFPHISESDS